VDTLPRLNPDDIRGAKGNTDQKVLFLHGVYSTVKYPRIARENGVRAAVGVTFLIDLEGKVSVEKTKAFSADEAKNIRAVKDELITITGYGSVRINGGPSTPAPTPRQTTNEKRLAKSYAALEKASADAILSLPVFTPGMKDGQPVVVRATRFFVFRLE